MRLEFYENGGDAVIELYWTPPGGKQEAIPADVLSTTYVRPLQARLPSPANGAADVVVPALAWKAGEDAKFHSVYIGTSPDLTAADLKSSRQFDLKFFYFPAMATPGVTYYWRVDEIEKDGVTTHAGDVWSFMMRALTAYRPIPADGSNEASPAPTLTLVAGDGCHGDTRSSSATTVMPSPRVRQRRTKARSIRRIRTSSRESSTV